MLKRLTIVLLLLPTAAIAQPWSGVLATARATDWTQAGIPGGIPVRSSVCANVLAGDTTAQIQTKLNACPQDGVVLFPAGTWNLTASLFVNNKGIVLRGAGPKQTTLHYGSGVNIFFGANGTSGQGGYANGPYFTTNISAGATKGSTVFTVSSTANLAAGQLVVVDWLNVSGVVFPTGNNGSQRAGIADPPGSNPFEPPSPSPREQFEMRVIAAVNDSTHVTIDVPLDYTAGSSPRLFWWDTPNLGNGTRYAGVENLKIDANGNDRAIMFDFCTYCWVRNVEIGNIARGAITTFWSHRCEFDNNYIWQAGSINGPTKYGFEIISSTLVKEENNILFNITSPFMSMSADSLVSGYNYSQHIFGPDNQFAAFEPHQAHNFLHLYEGNVTYGVNYDNVWGSSSHNTLFRTYDSGHSPNSTNYRTPINVQSQNRYINIVGNVLGDPTYHTQYVCNQANPQASDNFIYDLGAWNGCFAPTPYDSTVESSLMRWLNWDAVTYIANGNTNGIRSCTGIGVGNSACTASETASTDPTFPGLASPAATLPASFYTGAAARATCGTGLSFWKNPSTGACPVYPPIGPDVACTTNCITNTATHAAKIPAQLCYDNTAKDVNGYLTAFDALSCYSADTIVTVAPTGIQITGNPTFTGNVTLSVNTNGNPVMLIAPTSLAFGSVGIGGVSTLPLTITNTGNSTLIFTSVALADTSNYSQTNNCTSVAPLGTCTVNVTFSPHSAGTLNTTITLTANDVGSPHVVNITGTGIAIGGDLPLPTFSPIAFLLPQAWVDPMIYSTQTIQQTIYIGNSTCPLAPARTNYKGISVGATVCDYADSNGTGLQTVVNDWCSGTYGGDQRWDAIVTHGTTYNFGGNSWIWCDKYNGTPTQKFLVYHADTGNHRGRTVCSHGIQDVLTPPLPDAGRRNHGCIGFLGFPAPILGAQQQQLNADDTLTTGPLPLFEDARQTQGYLGWSLCIKPGCDPGGTGVPLTTSQTINNATPSQDGGSMLFSLTSKGTCVAPGCNTNVLWPDKVGIDDSLTTFQSDFWVYPVDGNASQREFDMFQFSLTEHRNYMFGLQCDLAGGKWQIFNQLAGTWNDTPTNCSGATGLPVGSWSHVIFNAHRVPGDTSCSGVACLIYDSLIVNGTTATWNISYPSGPLPNGWQSANGFQFQLNVSAINTTTAQYIDLAKFTASRADATAPMPVTNSAYTFDPSYNDLANMWTVTSSNTGVGSVIQMGPASTLGSVFSDCGQFGTAVCPTDGVNHIGFQDLHVFPATSITTAITPVSLEPPGWLTLGGAVLNPHDISASTHDIFMTESYFHGDADDDGFGNNALSNMVQFSCATCAFNHNYMDGVKKDGSEDHGINLSDSRGPLQVSHNYMEGASIVFWGGGGAPPAVFGLLTTNVERRRNWLTYNQRWLPGPAGLQSFSKPVSGGTCSGGNTLVLNINNAGSNVISPLVVYLKGITGVGTITNQWYAATTVTATAVTLTTACTNGTVTGGKVFGFSSNVTVTSAAAMNAKAVKDPTFNNPVAKNRSENKEAQSTVQDGEILENSGADGQAGYLLLVSVRACGGVSWCNGGQNFMISDWVTSNTVMRHGNQGIQISARSGTSNYVSYPITNTTCDGTGNNAAVTATNMNNNLTSPQTTQTVYGTDVYVTGSTVLANGFYATAYPTTGNYANDAVVTIKGTGICTPAASDAVGQVYGPASNNGAGVSLPGRRYVFQNNLIYDVANHASWNGGTGSSTMLQNSGGVNNFSVNMTVTQVTPTLIVNAAVTAISACPVNQLCPKVIQASPGDYAYIQCLADPRFSSGPPQTKGASILSVAGDQLSFTFTPQNGSPALTLSDTTSCPIATWDSSVDSGYYNAQSFPWPFYWNHNTAVGVNQFVVSPANGGFNKSTTYQNSFQLLPGTAEIAPANVSNAGRGFRCNNSDTYSASDATGITYCNDRPTFTFQRYIISRATISNYPNFFNGVTCAPSCSQDPSVNAGTNSAPARVSSAGAIVTCGGVACDATHFIPDSVGFAGSMSTSNYPLNLPDFRQYALDSSSPFKAGGILQGTDGKDVGVQMSILLNAQNRTLYPCSLPCGTGPKRDGPQYGFLTWNSSSDPGLINYRVYRDGSGSPTATVTNIYYTDYGLSAGGHTWIVKAWNGTIETTVGGLTSTTY